MDCFNGQLITTALHLLGLWLVLATLWPVNGLCLPPAQPFTTTTGRLTFSRSYLLELGHQLPVPTPAPLLTDNIPRQIFHNQKRKCIRRKRGSRGGIRNRLRGRGSRLPLPAIVLSNVRSLRNKADELSTLLQFDRDYRQTSLFCFTETWLTEDTDLQLDGFNIIRFDRDTARTRKSIGGGVCMAVNRKWATNFTVRETESCKHYELLTVSFRPHYLPREFSQLTVSAVVLAYVPGPDFNTVAERIADSYHRPVNQTKAQPVFLLGDFNHCDVSSQLPDLEQ